MNRFGFYVYVNIIKSMEASTVKKLKKVVKRTLYIHQVAMGNEQLLKDLKMANRKITKLQKKELSK